MADFDVIVVGSGPAGTAAAFALVDTGLRVAVVDGGRIAEQPAPPDSYAALRRDDAQWRVMIGAGYQALAGAAMASPKMGVPRYGFVFDGFRETYGLKQQDCVVHGSLAVGGLSNAWGAGVACFDDADLAAGPVGRDALTPSYRRIAERIGVAGQAGDAMAGFFGDMPLMPPNAAGPLAQALLRRFRGKGGLALGRPRNAVLTRPLAGRQACSECGLCLWGCAGQSIYNAAYDLEALKARGAVTHLPGFVAERLSAEGTDWAVLGRDARLTARRVILAAGAVGTGALVLRSLNATCAVPLLATPTAAFLLWQPGQLGRAVPQQFFGLAQASFAIDTQQPEDTVFGNLFDTGGLPVSAFIRHAPLSRPAARRLLRLLLPSMLAGNCFFPGRFSAMRLRLGDDGRPVVSGGHVSNLPEAARAAQSRLRSGFARCGGLLVPGSFTVSQPGSDMHYAGTVPMRARPAPHEAGADGQVAGLPGVYVADAAALASLPAKPHTFTTMANADRIAGLVARSLAG